MSSASVSIRVKMTGRHLLPIARRRCTEAIRPEAALASVEPARELRLQDGACFAAGSKMGAGAVELLRSTG